MPKLVYDGGTVIGVINDDEGNEVAAGDELNVAYEFAAYFDNKGFVNPAREIALDINRKAVDVKGNGPFELFDLYVVSEDFKNTDDSESKWPILSLTLEHQGGETARDIDFTRVVVDTYEIEWLNDGMAEPTESVQARAYNAKIVPNDDSGSEFVLSMEPRG